MNDVRRIHFEVLAYRFEHFGGILAEKGFRGAINFAISSISVVYKQFLQLGSLEIGVRDNNYLLPEFFRFIVQGFRFFVGPDEVHFEF